MAGSREQDVLPTPDTFAFPFQPYDIQVDFMKALYRYLEDNSCGILESPTGTVGFKSGSNDLYGHSCFSYWRRRRSPTIGKEA